MKNVTQRNRKLILSGSLILALALLLSACGSLAPTPDPQAQQATVDASVAQTLQAVAAELTSTAMALPTSTFTPAPTLEPTATFTPESTATLAPSPTNTWIPYTAVPNTPVPSATPTPGAYACKLISVSPADGTKIKANWDFDGVWTVKNIGTRRWEVGSLDLKYVSGTKLQTKGDIFDVSKEVAPGAEFTLIVDMKTPSTAGKYTAAWMLTMNGTDAFCSLPLNIEVVNP